MPYVFRTPVRITDGVRVPAKPNPKTEYDDGKLGNPLLRHFRREGPAACVIIDGTTVREKHSPTVAELRAATWNYLGGHEYTISQTERDLLVAAGYTVMEV